MQAEYMNRKVIVHCIDGQIIKGTITDWITAYDNDPDPESIIVSSIEIFLQEIDYIDLDEDSTQ